MQRITIEGFLIQYNPLHPMQYNDPLHLWGVGKKEGCRYSRNYALQQSFRAPNFKMGQWSQYSQVAVSQVASGGGKQPLG